MKTIVITGGPCSGKTSALDVLRTRFEQAGRAAVFVNEAATDLILNGISPTSLGSMLPFQKEVAKLQLRREAEAREEAAALGANTLIICDRGIADGAAYLKPEEYAQVLDTIGISSQEALERYDEVYCLESIAKGGKTNSAYTTANNSARSETPEEAAALDSRTQAAWETHPHYHFLPNTESFEEKIAPLIQGIMELAHM